MMRFGAQDGCFFMPVYSGIYASDMPKVLGTLGTCMRVLPHHKTPCQQQQKLFNPIISTRIMAARDSTKIFSLEGKGLKLTTAEDVEPHIKALRSMTDVEEIRLHGNTLGIDACKVIGDVLETKKTLQVFFPPSRPKPMSSDLYR
jgi:hypothetical protein